MKTNSAITPFSFNAHTARVITDEQGDPWFVAKDVCSILGLEQVSRALDRLPEKHRGLFEITHPQTAGGEPAKLALETQTGDSRFEVVATVREGALKRRLLKSPRPVGGNESLLPLDPQEGIYSIDTLGGQQGVAA